MAGERGWQGGKKKKTGNKGKRKSIRDKQSDR